MQNFWRTSPGFSFLCSEEESKKTWCQQLGEKELFRINWLQRFLQVGGTWKLEGFAEGLVSISFFVGFREIDHKESADNKYQTRTHEAYGWT